MHKVRQAIHVVRRTPRSLDYVVLSVVAPLWLFDAVLNATADEPDGVQKESTKMRLHRKGVEPLPRRWQRRMIPFHQRCFLIY